MNIVLYQPQIPPNTGNVARLCVATRCTLHLIHPLGFAADDATARRAGLDYWKYLSLENHSSWEDFCYAYPHARMHFFSKKAQRPYSQAKYQRNDFLVFGSETKGLPDTLLEQYAEDLWTIPMWGETRSLNLATSVGVVAYEALRQVTREFKEI